MTKLSLAIVRSAKKKCLQLVYEANASHIGGAFSVADILTVLYTDVLNYDTTNPSWCDRDRLFYSKGHACTILYALLHECGYFSIEMLQSFSKDGSIFTSHVNHKVPGVELSTGSLGHALNVACGVALAAKLRNKKWNVFAVLSDGELDEGSNWEAILFAPQHKLNNLNLIIDYNKIQSLGPVKDVLNLEPLKEKFLNFGWNAIEIDGHNHAAIKQACLIKSEKPKVIIAHTVKGKGIPFMENKLEWHYKSPSKEQLAMALQILEDESK
jgi:transketolase